MNVVKVISDTHNRHSDIPYETLDCDILVHCGDATNKGKVSELLRFFEWFNKAPAKYKIFIAGNHDMKAINHPDVKAKIEEYGIINPDKKLVEIRGLRIWGHCHTPKFSKDGNATMTVAESREPWKDMPDDLDILITHAPPHKILDVGGIKYRINLGCYGLRDKVRTTNVKHHVFGHVHEKRNQTMEVWGTKFYNCARLSRDHSDIIKKPVVIII